MRLNFVLYRSEASGRMTEEMILDILMDSYRNNSGEGLTGFLHFERGQFLQYIEGPKLTLMRRLARIQRDKRHRHFIMLADGDLDERIFPDWEMGVLRPDAEAARQLLATLPTLASDADIDPLPLLHSFAAQAGVSGGLSFFPAA